VTHNKDKKDNEITAKQKKFVNSVASGDSATTAYIDVYDCKRESAASGASRLMSMPNIRDELTRLKDAAEKDTLMKIDQKRAMLAEIVLTPAWNLDPKSPLAQSVKIKRRTLPDGTVEEDITVRMPNKLRAMELDTKLSGELNQSGKRTDGDTWEIVEERYRDARNRVPACMAESSIHQVERIYKNWDECKHDPFDGKKKTFLRLLGKVIEFGKGCRFMDDKLTYVDLNAEVVAATEKREKRKK